MAETVELGKDMADDLPNEENFVDDVRDKKDELPRARNRKKLFKTDTNAADKRGVCYLSRVPPHMNPSNLRHILSRYGEMRRIYLTPEDPAAQVQRKRGHGFQGKGFSEGWVEFTKRSVAKKVANMLNGEQIGGKRRSSLYYDIWNIKYLSKFKWDDLTGENADKHASRKQKRALDISAAKKERDFYLSKVEQSRDLHHMRERMKKKQKTVGPESNGSGTTVDVQEPKVIRQFVQNRSVGDTAVQNKPRLSKDILAGVFGGSGS